MQFVDEAVVHVEAGHGGKGASHFRREKFIAKGGPDGGNGGRGGSVIIEACSRKHTLLDFKYQPIWKAENGMPGGGSLKDGRAGKDLVIKVPVGTQVYNNDSGELVADLKKAGERVVLAKGGLGGKGNASFKSATRQAPTYAQKGLAGEKGTFLLSLKLLADIGLVGYPNSGKSTLISRISSAKPKIADYPFTTLSPNLGLVKGKGSFTFVVADIPGLIEGASRGKGLGIKYLKHIERTKVLAHLVDPIGATGKALIEKVEAINKELSEFSPDLVKKKQILVITKIDAQRDSDAITNLEAYAKEKGIICKKVSSVSGEGLQELIDAFCALLQDDHDAND